MVKIIIYFFCVLIYWFVRINLDRIGEIFFLLRILGIGFSFLVVVVLFLVLKYRREV